MKHDFILIRIKIAFKPLPQAVNFLVFSAIYFQILYKVHSLSRYVLVLK